MLTDKGYRESLLHRPKILVVDDDEMIVKQINWALDNEYDVYAACNRASALKVFVEEDIPVVLLDLGLPPEPSTATEVSAQWSAIDLDCFRLYDLAPEDFDIILLRSKTHFREIYEPLCQEIVIVDSGSSDGSVAVARSLGVEVIELDTSLPFTMARGRNAGVRHLLATDPDLQDHGTGEERRGRNRAPDAPPRRRWPRRSGPST